MNEFDVLMESGVEVGGKLKGGWKCHAQTLGLGDTSQTRLKFAQTIGFVYQTMEIR